MSRIRRHIAVDTEYLLHAIHITTANISDKADALEMISLHVYSLSHLVSVPGDGGYAGRPFAGCVKDMTGADVEIVKRSDLHQFTVLPRRRVVERSFGRPDKGRRLWKNCKRRLHTSCQTVIFAFIALLLKRS